MSRSTETAASPSERVLELLHDPARQDILKLVDDTLALIQDVIRQALPNVEVRNTGHFNHTYLPSFLLQWQSAENLREVYTRFHPESPDALVDIDEITALARYQDSTDAPIVCYLHSFDTSTVALSLTEPIRKNPQVLLTEIDAFGKMTNDPSGQEFWPDFVQTAGGILDAAAVGKMGRSLQASSA